MYKLNKQDFIFIGEMALYIAITSIAYLFIAQNFITNNCYHGMSLAESSGYRCFGYFSFFDKVSIYFYILFLWITIVLYMRKKYLFPSKTIFIGGIVVLILVIIGIYMVTPIISLDEYIEGLPRIGR